MGADCPGIAKMDMSRKVKRHISGIQSVSVANLLMYLMYSGVGTSVLDVVNLPTQGINSSPRNTIDHHLISDLGTFTSQLAVCIEFLGVPRDAFLPMIAVQEPHSQTSS